MEIYLFYTVNIYFFNIIALLVNTIHLLANINDTERWLFYIKFIFKNSDKHLLNNSVMLRT